MKTKTQWVGMVTVACGLLAVTGANATLVVNPVAGSASYSMYNPQGGYAMRMDTPSTTQTRLQATGAGNILTVPMAGLPITMESSMDMMWLDRPETMATVNPTGSAQRYWDCQIVVGGVTYTPSGNSFGVYWNWAQFPVTNVFTRWVQTFTLPAVAFDNVGGTNVNIEAWKLLENRTIQLYDGSTFDASSVLIDNISLRNVAGGANLNFNGDFASNIDGWFNYYHPGNLSLFGPLPTPEPSTALLLFAGGAVVAGYRRRSGARMPNRINQTGSQPGIRTMNSKWLMPVIAVTLALGWLPLAQAALVASPIAGAASYDTYVPAGGTAAQFDRLAGTVGHRLEAVPTYRQHTITMSGSDVTMESVVAMKWLDLPDPLPGTHWRYWDVGYVVGPTTNYTALGLVWDWAEFPAGPTPYDPFTEWTQTFTLPHLASNTVTMAFEEIDTWLLIENRTLDIYVGSSTFFDASSVQVDRVSLRALPGGSNLNFNGDFDSLDGWQVGFGGGTLSLVTLGVPEPATVALLLIGGGLMTSYRRYRLGK